MPSFILMKKYKAGENEFKQTSVVIFLNSAGIRERGRKLTKITDLLHLAE